MNHANQSSFIAFVLFAAFIVFITVRGELATYVGFFVGGTQGSGSGSGNITITPTGSASNTNAPQASADALSAAQTALLEGAQLAIIA